VPIEIRDFETVDRDAIVELALRAWAPVFASVEAVLGAELSRRLHGGGFAVATTADSERRIGEIVMLAVDPSSQRRGVGRTLTDHATAWLRDAGMRVALIATGGDPGHAAARALYEQAGYQLLPAAQYFKSL
jgi:ribosomal protein S18 acetylase RimI-like enzyme